jgi:hypothetical protein
MSVPELALAKIRRFCEERTPAHLRDEMRLEATTRGNSVTVFDCRPPWDATHGEWTRMNIAQLRYDPALGAWTLYWADRNSRWHRYDDLNPTSNVDELIIEIDQDPTSIFFG